MAQPSVPIPAPVAPKARLTPGVLAALAVGAIAVFEAVVAVAAPYRAPEDTHWRAAQAEVRAGFRAGDLIVAAPAWADPVMRLHLGDLVPLEVAGRLDAARFPRIWEISQKGGRAPDTAGLAVAHSSRHGPLTVRRFDQTARQVTYDFIDRRAEARVFRVEPARGSIPCPRQGDRFQCPDYGFNFIAPQTVEVDARLYRALLAQPVGATTPVVMEYPAAVLGRELAVGAGLHNVWQRKLGTGTVTVRVLVEGRPVLTLEAGSRTGWRVTRGDTSAWMGRTVPVRFEITSPAPYARHFAFAAEARR